MKFTSSAAVASVALAAASLVSASSSESASLESRTFGANQFWWKSGNCALNKGGPPKIEAKPKEWDVKGWTCPPGPWSYSSRLACCIPHVEVEAVKETPSCASTHSWDRASKCCKKFVPKSTVPSPPAPPATKCKANEFEWSLGNTKVCLPTGGEKNPPSPPKGKDCKTAKGGFNWHSGHGCCVPTQPTAPPAPVCVNGKWDTTGRCCKTPSTPTPPSPPTTPKTACKANEFEWSFGDKNVCLPHGGEKNPPSPPKGKDCQTHTGGRHWSNVHGCCVPKTPDVPKTPVCIKGRWDTTGRCCHSPPTPPTTTPPPQGSHRAVKRREHKSIRAVLPLDGRVDPARCPKNLTACPIVNDEYECLDPLAELTSCGGCASTGAGVNCMLIDNVESVTCNVGVCAVLSCRSGLAPSVDGKSCVPVLTL